MYQTNLWSLRSIGSPPGGTLIQPPVKTTSNALYMGFNSNDGEVTGIYIYENSSGVHFEVFNISSLPALPVGQASYFQRVSESYNEVEL